MITALAVDYQSVFYVDLGKDEGICYRSNEDLCLGIKKGDVFPFHEKIVQYANTYVAEADRPGFLKFIEPNNICMKLRKNRCFRTAIWLSGRMAGRTMRCFASWRSIFRRKDLRWVFRRSVWALPMLTARRVKRWQRAARFQRLCVRRSPQAAPRLPSLVP